MFDHPNHNRHLLKFISYISIPTFQPVIYRCYDSTLPSSYANKRQSFRNEAVLSRRRRRSCSDWLKMPGMMFALLISAGVLLTSAQASFNKLPETYKKGVELALKHINAHEGVQHHFLFSSSIQQSQIEVIVSLLVCHTEMRFYTN